jgi:hypothetical protein
MSNQRQQQSQNESADPLVLIDVGVLPDAPLSVMTASRPNVRRFVSDPNGRITTERYESSDAPNSSIGYIAGFNRQIREQLKPYSPWGRLGYAEVARFVSNRD